MAAKKMPLAKKLILIAAPLVCAQLAYIFLFQGDVDTESEKDAINTQISKESGLDSDRKELVKVQLALTGYRLKNDTYPSELSKLVPDFLDTIPLDPTTGAPFDYEVKDDAFVLGDITSPAPGSFANTTGKQGQKGKDAPQDEQSQLLAYLDQGDDQEVFIYDPSSKRDPFRSYDFSPKTSSEGGNTPLEKWSYSELKLAAVLEGFGEPKAVVEDPTGKGHTVNVGTKLGHLGGEVMKIEGNKITILEKSVDFTGETETRTVELFLR